MEENITWTHAKQLCETMGGILPYKLESDEKMISESKEFNFR